MVGPVNLEIRNKFSATYLKVEGFIKIKILYNKYISIFKNLNRMMDDFCCPGVDKSVHRYYEYYCHKLMTLGKSKF